MVVKIKAIHLAFWETQPRRLFSLLRYTAGQFLCMLKHALKGITGSGFYFSRTRAGRNDSRILIFYFSVLCHRNCPALLMYDIER